MAEQIAYLNSRYKYFYYGFYLSIVLLIFILVHVLLVSHDPYSILMYTSWAQQTDIYYYIGISAYTMLLFVFNLGLVFTYYTTKKSNLKMMYVLNYDVKANLIKTNIIIVSLLIVLLCISVVCIEILYTNAMLILTLYISLIWIRYILLTGKIVRRMIKYLFISFACFIIYLVQAEAYGLILNSVNYLLFVLLGMTTVARYIKGGDLYV